MFLHLEKIQEKDGTILNSHKSDSLVLKYVNLQFYVAVSLYRLNKLTRLLLKNLIHVNPQRAIAH